MGYLGFQFVLIAFSLIWGNSAQAVVCPDTYVDNGAGVCIPALSQTANTEFTLGADGNPFCGPGRVALSSDGNYTWSNFSSSGRPRVDPANNYSWTSSDGTIQNYTYVSSTSPNSPLYGYGPQTRCYCLGKGLGNTIPESPPVFTNYAAYNQTLASGGSRQYPVTLDVIASQDSNGAQFYGPVPIDKTASKDGRAWVEISGGGNASCGCPNVNEDVVVNGTDPVPLPYIGTHCAAMFAAIPPTGGGITGTPNTARVLTLFDPVLHAGQVMSGGWEVTDAGGVIMTQIQLPQTGGTQDSGTGSYYRKIWTCAAPYELNTGAKTCDFIPAHHRCDDGSGGGPPSPVSDLVSPVPAPAAYATQFNNTVNRKLACCLNAFHGSSVDNFSYEKFDCIDNSNAGLYTSFDDLWSKSDDPADGGQANALMLSDSTKVVGAVRTPRIVSGFYSLAGAHCDQFSEFAYTPGSGIKHYRVDPAIVSGQQNKVGAAPVAFGVDIPVPNGAGYTAMNAKVVGTLGKTTPANANDYRSCPILVRAAVVASCPSQTVIPNRLTSVNRSATGGPRCSAAAGIQIHVRIEQVFEITGAPPIKPIDSFLQTNETSSIDVSKMILEKTGDLCPPSTTKRGDHCIYN